MTKQIWPRNPDFRYDAAGKGRDGDVHEIVLGRENASGLDQDYSKVLILAHSRVFRAHGKPKSLTSCHCNWRLSLAAGTACNKHALNSTECSVSAQ